MWVTSSLSLSSGYKNHVTRTHIPVHLRILPASCHGFDAPKDTAVLSLDPTAIWSSSSAVSLLWVYGPLQRQVLLEMLRTGSGSLGKNEFLAGVWSCREFFIQKSAFLCKAWKLSLVFFRCFAESVFEANKKGLPSTSCISMAWIGLTSFSGLRFPRR